MRLKHSLFTRRQFLNGLLGGWLAALVGSFLYPVIKFVFPPYREPDQVILPLADYRDIPTNSVKIFPWGSKPGLLKKNDDGSLLAFLASRFLGSFRRLFLYDQFLSFDGDTETAEGLIRRPPDVCPSLIVPSVMTGTEKFLLF